ncbi:Ubiquitin carboxyl-terminal hydrolase 10 [Merluccius polli]|uniref:Ubiquitin carboxyl-terminal hydrolase 10 n=1 Tax=Merluccius polli TaxID=89951 RepID=A0AA47P4U2_MERPO|nr:Ubiquitin carboxyl-terminal hydrolase 10 [Merluccius polli]
MVYHNAVCNVFFSSQYIFGEFSPDEINQFFVTPRCYVELPPFNDKVPCVSQSTGSHCTPAVPYIMESMRRQVCAEDYQHIEFGVDEVMESAPVGVKDPLFKVSSTLNPQAPEFILGCQSVQNAQQAAAPSADVMDGVHFDLLDCPDSEASAVDNHQVCQDSDGISGGPRERRKKKKRPPGYYNYLEGSAGNGGGGGTIADGMPVPGLLNGHALRAPNHSVDNVVGKALLVAELSSPGPVSVVTPTAVVVQANFASVAIVDQRTCISPGLSSLDLTSRAGSLLDGNNATSSSSASSQSSGAAEEPQIADQQPDNLTPQSPTHVDSGTQSPCSKSPIPPTASVASPVASLDTAASEPEEAGDFGVANGLAESDAAVSTDGHTDDRCEAVGPVQPVSPDSVAQPASEQVHASSTPPANPPKSWASLFHNSKPLPGGPQAFVEMKNVVEVVAPPSPVVPKQPEKAGEVKESPVHVSEDPMAPKLAELIDNVKLIHKPVSLQPRGLINKGNWCYINAVSFYVHNCAFWLITLQALIACPPMYHLMKSIPLHNDSQRPCTSTPMIDNL